MLALMPTNMTTQVGHAPQRSRRVHPGIHRRGGTPGDRGPARQGDAYRSLRAMCRELDVPKTTLLRRVRRAEDPAASTLFGAVATDEPEHDCAPRRPPATPALRRRTGTPFDDRIATLYDQNQR